MKTKGKKMKAGAQNTGMAKMDAKMYYSCSYSGSRHFCANHCKKCYFEIMYCHK